MPENASTEDDSEGQYERIDDDEAVEYEVYNAQTEVMFRSAENGQIVAVERGVEHGSPYSVTRFAAPIWETYEPLEYHGDGFTTPSEAIDHAKEVLADIAEGKID